MVACDAARDRLRYTRLVSPIDGTITERGIEPGEVVTPGLQATFEGKALLTVSNLATLVVKAELNQIDVAKVELGQKVTVTLDALPGRSYAAVVTKIAPASTMPKGKDVESFPVEATLQSAEGAIRPGMTADVRIHVETRAGVLALPVEAVTREQGRRYVTRLLPGDRGATRARVEVELGRRSDREVEVVSGIAEGDRVLIDPSSSAANEYTE
jgi:RND family efflux transporter MFP subunit